MTGLHRLVVLLGLVVGGFATTTGAAYAYWSSTATATMTITTSALLATPAAPTNLACGGTNDPRTLSWTASARATEYHVYRDTGTLLFTVTATNLQMSELAMGSPQNTSQRYDVFVRAANEGGESPSSASLTVSFKGGRAC